MNWLVASRQYISNMEAQKERRWDIKKDVFTTSIHDQVGKKVGILGYGSIGRQSTYNGSSTLHSNISMSTIDHHQLPVFHKPWE